MSMASACPIELTDLMRAELRRLVRAATTAQSLVSRARIVLLGADGHTNAAIGELTGVCTDTARKWRARFARNGMEGLADARRSGRPPRFTPVQVARAKALACQLPAQSGLPLSRWSAPDLAQQMIDSGIVDSISASTVRRWLATDAIKPWQHQSWIFISDPDFALKAGRVLDLYAGQWDGQPLGEGDYVISADE